MLQLTLLKALLISISKFVLQPKILYVLTKHLKHLHVQNSVNHNAGPQKDCRIVRQKRKTYNLFQKSFYSRIKHAKTNKASKIKGFKSLQSFNKFRYDEPMILEYEFIN